MKVGNTYSDRTNCYNKQISKLISNLFFFKAPVSVKHFYEKAELKCRQVTKLAFKGSLILVCLIIGIFPAFCAIYNIARGKLDTLEWIQIFRTE